MAMPADGAAIAALEPVVVVASTAAMKVGAVRRLTTEGCFGGAATAVEAVAAVSGVNEQPFGHEETVRGVLNRLVDARRLRPGARWYIAVENGIFELATESPRYFDVAWVAVDDTAHGLGIPALAHSVGIEFPREFVESARAEGFDRTHAGHKIAARNPGVDKQDPHRWLSAERVSREDLLVGALSAAWGQLEKRVAEAGAGCKFLTA
mmetsp:Transcript_64971/g.188375  ORF Transcript_64971/g.188375 Transcript_64971/m.188375 type:complete len:208 (+) Transcript_64971:160-783(+)